MKIIEIKNISLFIVTFIINFSCNKKNDIIEVKSFDDGQKIISYGVAEIVDSIVIEKNDLIVSKFISKFRKKNNKMFSVFFYDKSGKLTSKGNMNNNKKIGVWSYFKENKLIRQEEYLSINNKLFINQTWNFYGNGKINFNKSNFYSYVIKDTILAKQNFQLLKIKFYPDKNINSKKIYFYASDKLKEDFSNIFSLDLIEIPKNKNNEYELVFDKNINLSIVKGFFVEEFNYENKIKQKYTLVKIANFR